MQSLLPYLLAAWTWIQAHPLETALIVIALFNVLYAQVPREKGGKVDKIFEALHYFSLIFVTKAEDKGTFRLPALVKMLLEFFSKSSSEMNRQQQETIPDSPKAKDDDKGSEV